MQIQQKSYAQILIVERTDFIFGMVYDQYEQACPFMCFPGDFARDFRVTLKKAEDVLPNKDVILLLADYWVLLSSEEKKAILDHELGHIAEGHLKKLAEKFKSGNRTNEVDETEEKEADAYSADLNGKKAMYNALIKALDVIVGGYKKKGYSVSISQIINNTPIIKNRLKVLADEKPATAE